MTEPSLWLEIGKTFGFAGLVLLVVLYGLYRLGVLAIERMGVPLVSRLMASQDKTDKSLEEMVEVSGAIRDTLVKMEMRMARLEESRDERCAK